jgi:hypothetical protein
MSRPAKPAAIRFCVDADVLGLAKILVQIRPDVTYPGDPGGTVKGHRLRPPCPITDPRPPGSGRVRNSYHPAGYSGRIIGLLGVN